MPRKGWEIRVWRRTVLDITLQKLTMAEMSLVGRFLRRPKEEGLQELFIGIMRRWSKPERDNFEVLFKQDLGQTIRDEIALEVWWRRTPEGRKEERKQDRNAN